MNITNDQIKKIANLAMLTLTPEQEEKFPKQIASILEYVTKLSEIKTDDIEYQSHVELKNVMRDDVSTPSIEQSAAVQNRKESQKQGAFTINAVLHAEE